MKPTLEPKPTLGAYLVGAYLFSVPAFAYSESMGLLIIPQVLGGLLIAYAVLDILGHMSVRIPREILLYGLMGLWALLTFGWGAASGDTNSLVTLIKVVVATLACAQLIRDDIDLYAALKIFVFSIVLVYYQNRFELGHLRMADQTTEADRFAGTLANANTAAIFSLTVIWASVLLLLRSGGRRFSRALLLVPIAISLLVIYYSGSKKGLIGLGLYVLFLARLLYIRQRASRSRRALVVLASVFLIVLAGYFIYTSPFFFRVHQLVQGLSGSDMNRIDLAREAVGVWLSSVKTFVMGVGYDTFQSVSLLQTYAHSTPLELLASNGIVGLCLFMSFYFLLVYRFVFLYRHASDVQIKSSFFSSLIFLFVFFFFMLAAVLHDSRELLPILGALAAYGQFQFLRLRTSE